MTSCTASSCSPGRLGGWSRLATSPGSYRAQPTFRRARDGAGFVGTCAPSGGSGLSSYAITPLSACGQPWGRHRLRPPHRRPPPRRPPLTGCRPTARGTTPALGLIDTPPRHRELEVRGKPQGRRLLTYLTVDVSLVLVEVEEIAAAFLEHGVVPPWLIRSWGPSGSSGDARLSHRWLSLYGKSTLTVKPRTDV